jgi:hypothetical protein
MRRGEAFPESHGFFGIVSGLRHVKKADVIGFRFLQTAVRQFDAEFSEATQRHHRDRRIFFRHGGADGGRGFLHSLRLTHAFAAVMIRRVRYFVPNDRSEAGLISRNRQDAGVNANFSAGQTECIRFGTFKDDEFPFGIRHSVFGLFGNARAHFGDERVVAGVFADGHFFLHFIECRQPELRFLIGGDDVELLPACRTRRAACDDENGDRG